jgi:hypothetical protein
MNTSQSSQSEYIPVYKRTWAIKDFPTLMEYSGSTNGADYLSGDSLKISSRSSGKKWEFQLKCWPNWESNVHLRVFPVKNTTIDGSVYASVAFKLLEKEGGHKLLKDVVHNWWDKDESINCDVQASHQMLKDSADQLMPCGVLTICVEIQILPSIQTMNRSELTTKPVSPAKKMKSSNKENIRKTMLDNFVDIGPSSVILVFEDGEQRCHTFPLAAR